MGFFNRKLVYDRFVNGRVAEACAGVCVGYSILVKACITSRRNSHDVVRCTVKSPARNTVTKQHERSCNY